MKNIAAAIFFLLLFASPPANLPAQSPSDRSLAAGNSVPPFTRFTMEQGLADNWALTAHQDNRGFIWFGTEGGLSRFDGQSFLNFYENKNAPNSLGNSTVRDICEDPDGSLWLATLNGGLNRFDPATGIFEAFKTDPDHPALKDQPLSIISICQGGDLLWLGTYHHGIGRFDKKKRRFTGWFSLAEDELIRSNSFAFNTANQVVKSKRQPDILWVAAANRGVARFDTRTGKCELFPIFDACSIAGVSAMRLVEDDEGMIWVASWSGGVVKIDPATRRQQAFPYNFPFWKNCTPNRNVVTAILEKSPGEFWVATEDNGFGIFTKSTGEFHWMENRWSGESPERDRNCHGLFLDHRRRLWVLGVEGGARLFDFEAPTLRYVSLSENASLTETDEVTDFAFDPRLNVLYAATENSGCLAWSEQDGHLRQLAKPLSGGAFPRFRAVLVDSKGNLWAGAIKLPGGEASLYLLRPGSHLLQPVTLPGSPSWVGGGSGQLFEGRVNDIFEDAQGNVWVATSYDGLYQFSENASKIKHFSDVHGFEPGAPAFERWWAFLEIEQDERGHLWAAVNGTGILDFDPATGKFFKYNQQNLLRSNNVSSLETGAGGRIWTGMKNQGWQGFAPTSPGDALREIPNLPSPDANYVSAIEKDESGNLWLATEQGLVACDPGGKPLRFFGKAEGLKTTYLVGKALAVIPGFGVAVGQANGFCIFRQPVMPKNQAAQVRVALSDFKVFDQSKYFEKRIRTTELLSLKPSENVFSFEFATPGFLQAGLASYLFRLDGFDENWYRTEGSKSITYTGLAPGSYLFRVKASFSGGQNTPETQLKIYVQPRWWQTWLAKILAAALVAAAVFAVYKFRTRQLKREIATQKQLAELERKALQAQMNPHFIFNCLNSIQNYIVANDNLAAARYLACFAKLVRSTLNASVAGKISLSEEVGLLENYLALEKMRLGNRFDFEVKVDPDTDPFEVKLLPMLVQPYVENAVLHGIRGRASGGRIEVIFKENAGFLEVCVQDNGSGFSPAANPVSTSSADSINPDSPSNPVSTGSADRISPSPHKSVGMSITRRRLELLEKSDRTDFLQVEEIKAEDGKVTGMKVRLKIRMEEG